MIKLKPKSIESFEIEDELQTVEKTQETSTFRSVLVDSFLITSKAYLESTEKNQIRWVEQFFNRLRISKRNYS
jgi:hypothetical protein